MENNVVSLDLAKRLKAAGLEIDAPIFGWQLFEGTWTIHTWDEIDEDAEWYIAFTAQEIADALPTQNGKGWLAMRKTESGYSTYYEQDEDYYDECKASTLANALGEQFLLQGTK